MTGAKFESIFPTDWVAKEQKSVPFEVLPVLYETLPASAEGAEDQILEIPESEAIERYLARKFNLLGDTPWEEMRIDAFVSSTKTLIYLAFSRVPTVRDPVQKQEMVEQLLEKAIPKWVGLHERYLKANGTNGHYVGLKLTLADIRAVIVIQMILALTENRVISAESTPALWKLWQTMNEIPSYVIWKESAGYRQLDAGYQIFIKTLLPPKE
ncbi:hypothetical protein BC939DRAFT_466161 [Gamsiella multidivaricata]|uniref:uncharacterized protein n=1 Tax=Gamsiella multidivaricata TaxID=101098 RepID=UPI0022204623|nr:uncharacterized protein BC939DRAFT_466161 [Gamsiella multidivaricata]KAI7817360.1 hypothetical protein BC939DRAFT_466161 [Gamsiella multidivaricata]